MEGQSRHIVVNGPYFAHAEIDTLILSKGDVYTAQQPSRTTQPTEDVEFEEVRSSSPASDNRPKTDTSFFTSRFPEDTVRKNIREAIDFASSKADACRRIMALETQGYIILSNVGDDRKAELINPYAQPKFTLTGEDFKKARNRR